MILGKKTGGKNLPSKKPESSMQSSKPIMLLHTSASSPITLDITRRQGVRERKRKEEWDRDLQNFKYKNKAKLFLRYQE